MFLACLSMHTLIGGGGGGGSGTGCNRKRDERVVHHGWNKGLTRIPNASDVFSFHVKDPPAWRLGMNDHHLWCLSDVFHATEIFCAWCCPEKGNPYRGVLLETILPLILAPSCGSCLRKELSLDFVAPCMSRVALRGLVQFF